MRTRDRNDTPMYILCFSLLREGLGWGITIQEVVKGELAPPAATLLTYAIRFLKCAQICCLTFLEYLSCNTFFHSLGGDQIPSSCFPFHSYPHSLKVKCSTRSSCTAALSKPYKFHARNFHRSPIKKSRTALGECLDKKGQ